MFRLDRDVTLAPGLNSVAFDSAPDVPEHLDARVIETSGQKYTHPADVHVTSWEKDSMLGWIARVENHRGMTVIMRVVIWEDA